MDRQAAKALVLATVAFAISFALWGMIAPMARTFQAELHLSDGQVWALIAIPVLLGSVLRLPMGMLADRYGGRVVFGLLLLFSALPAVMLSRSHSFGGLVLGGLLLGLAGTSFSIGVAMVARWSAPERQGLALGIYGLGTGGQSLALVGVPLLADRIGWRTAYLVFGAAAAAWGVVFLLVARDAPARGTPKPFGEMISVLYTQPLSWLLGLFYFATFGGFVALSIGLPKLLQELFHLTRQDAGLRVGLFVLLAASMRPVGGWLSDRAGGSRVLGIVFAGAAVFALALTAGEIAPFTVGALGTAVCIGLGNGAVFKLVPQYFPRDTGTVTGLVGAMGGLGGFFPPLLLGVIKSTAGSYAPGFVLLSVFCVACAALNHAVFQRAGASPGGAPLAAGVEERS